MPTRGVEFVCQTARCGTAVPQLGFPQFGWSLDLNGPSFFSQGRRLANKTYFTNGNRGVIYMADFTNPTAAGSTKVAVKELLHERMLKPGRTRHPGALENEGLWLLIMNEHGIRLCTCASEIPVILIKIRGISNTSRTQMFTPAHTRIHRRTPTHDLSHTPNTMYNRFFLRHFLVKISFSFVPRYRAKIIACRCRPRCYGVCGRHSHH